MIHCSPGILQNGGIKLIHHAQQEWHDTKTKGSEVRCVAIDITKGMGFNNDDYCLLWHIVPQVYCRKGRLKLIHPCTMRMTRREPNYPRLEVCYKVILEWKHYNQGSGFSNHEGCLNRYIVPLVYRKRRDGLCSAMHNEIYMQGVKGPEVRCMV